MIATDSDSLFCDMMEAYHVDYTELPPSKAAILAWGLSPDSRIKKRLSDGTADINTLLLAAAVDRLSFLAWAKTKDAEKGRNRPESILGLIQGKKDNDTTAFVSGEEYEEARRRIIESRENG